MSYQDFNNGYNGNYSGTPDAGSNESYRRGVFQAQDDARNAELDDFISKGGLNGFGSGSGNPASTSQKIIAYFFIGLSLFIIFGFIFFVGLNIFIHSMSSSPTQETAQEKLLQNRRPFEFNGYTLYSGPRHDKFIRFSLENPDGNIIWRQPKSMDHLWVKEDRPSGYITTNKDIHPGRTTFTMIMNGPQKQNYLKVLVINRAGKVIQFSDNLPRRIVSEKLPFNLN